MPDDSRTTDFCQERRRLLKTAGLLVPAIATLRAKPTLADCVCSGDSMAKYGYRAYTAEPVKDKHGNPVTDNNGEPIYKAVASEQDGYFKTAGEADNCSDPKAKSADNYPYK